MAVEESCIYTLTPDQNPIIDRVTNKKNILIAVGFSGMGFKLGPVTGRMLAAELEIVVELGNLVPRKNLASQKVFWVLRYLQS